MIKNLEKYINKLEIPRYHYIKLQGRYLKLIQSNFYIEHDRVWSGYDNINVIDTKNVKYIECIDAIDTFIERALKTIRTEPYQRKYLEDIDNIGYENIWDFQYSDCGKKDRKERNNY